ncbi:hypothetical protein XELAEV_18027497mg [Xenopus laevis]|uniref:Uncharacterized protein n=1 Tax=Xenopus laevis TaxID=8355 RepID=A0A974CWG2_XENLA|nr:hypothetical protein XELAEV_18027497mg [Xenopus laevis]
MNHHRHKINNKSCDTPVGQHFCPQNHSLQDMQVLILKGNFKTKQERKIYEFKCMELFNTFRAIPHGEIATRLRSRRQSAAPVAATGAGDSFPLRQGLNLGSGFMSHYVT